jgi:hypothetical protein
MKKNLLMSVLAVLAVAALAVPALAIDHFLIKESQGDNPAGAPVPCPLTASRNGNCNNYRWYNVCSGYIWIFSPIPQGDGFGTRFSLHDGQVCVTGGNVVKRTITYFRNVVPNYNQTVDVFLQTDDGDGCKDPGSDLAADLNMDPGLRWNCSNFGVTIPSGTKNLIVKSTHDGGSSPTWATDGPFTAVCDPNGNDHSYYYNAATGACLPWRLLSPTGRGDNFLTWLIIDGTPNAAEPTTWGNIKGLYR